MTITRLWQAHAELNSYALEFSSRNNVGFHTSSVKKNTGSYAFRTSSNGAGTQNVTASTQIRCGFHANHAGLALGSEAFICRFRDGSNNVVGIQFDSANGEIDLTLNGSVVASESAGTLANTDEWVHIGIDFKLHSTGWAYIYIDGVETIAYTGDTTAGGSSVNSGIFGSTSAFNQWATYLYLDDLFIDSSEGEPIPLPVEDTRWDILVANDNGSNSEWTGSDSNQTDNYLLVDDIPPDSDTSYVTADSANLKDTYQVETFSLPSGFTVRACGPIVVAKKSDAGVASQIKTVTINGATEFNSTAINLSTDYAMYWPRSEYLVDADNNDWTEANVNSSEFGILSAGSF